MGTWILHPGYGFTDEMSAEADALDASFPSAHGHLVSEIPSGSVVVPRYRMLPFARELDDEIRASGSTLINSYRQHRWAADIGDWYSAFEGLTPRTWVDVSDIDPGYDGAFIVKGETNSRRQLWSTHCFAPSRAQLGSVMANLYSDSLISHQKLWIREFVPLHGWGEDVVGMPVSEEYRLFFLDGREVARGFYWANHLYDLNEAGVHPDPSVVPDDLVSDIAARLAGHIRFCAVDVARTEAGDWVVIEVNDGPMSGPCGADPGDIYRALADLQD
jgi:hypothetical protein